MTKLHESFLLWKQSDDKPTEILRNLNQDLISTVTIDYRLRRNIHWEGGGTRCDSIFHATPLRVGEAGQMILFHVPGVRDPQTTNVETGILKM